MDFDEILDARQIRFELSMGNHFHAPQHLEIELIYVFDGQLDIDIEQDHYLLRQDDFLIVNRQARHRLQASSQALTGHLLVSSTLLGKLLSQTNMVFWCNSVLEQGSAYDAVRKIFKELIKDYFLDTGASKIYLIAKYFEILHLIVNHFLVTRQDTGRGSIQKDADRISRIRAYVEDNYQSKLNLSELAGELYLTEAFLSKYIKKHFKMNFLDYANSVRLNHAMADLLYQKDSITRIAMQNGFANVGTFNRVFKEQYGSTPKGYRQNLKTGQDEKAGASQAEALRQRVDAYILAHPVEDARERGQKESCEIDCASKGSPIDKIWGRMINVGTAPDLLKSNLQNQIKEICSRLRFKYIRIWDLYASEMYIDIHAKNHVYNFDKLDRVLDFVVSIGVYPYLELNIKPKILLQSVRKTLIQEDTGLKFEDLETLSHFMRSLVMHLIDRYSIDQVENWFFEFWKAELDDPSEESQGKIISTDKYLDLFGALASAIRHYLPNAKVGGGGLSIRYGRETLEEVLDAWKKHPVQPDFLTFYSYPYVVGERDFIKANKTTTDRRFLANSIQVVREVIQASGYADLPVHVSEWNSTVSNRNLLNDSCFKGAYIMDNLISVHDQVDLIGYWFASDVYADFIDSNEIINGSSGLFSKDGIPKPAYYAIEFMNRLGNRVLGKGENFLVTDTGYKEIRIVCHNYKFPNHRYFAKAEDELVLQTLDELYTDLESKTIEFKLQFEQPGVYEIKTHAINQQYGSLQDEWIRMSCPRNLIQEDVNYLKRICVPRISIHIVEVEDQTLSFATRLEPNEIQFIQIKSKFR